MLDVIFLILPYLKLVRVIKQEKQSIMEPGLFFDVIDNLIKQLNRQDLNKALMILTKQDEEFVKTLSHEDFIKILPVLIKENHFVETMFILRNLGMFD